MKTSSEESFVKQLKENQNIIHKICRLYTSDEDAHKDLFQEITIQLWKAYPQFRGDSKFTTWAYRVGLNTAITLYRKKKRSIEMYKVWRWIYQIIKIIIGWSLVPFSFLILIGAKIFSFSITFFSILIGSWMYITKEDRKKH